jgi:hypothetical protein
LWSSRVDLLAKEFIEGDSLGTRIRRLRVPLIQLTRHNSIYHREVLWSHVNIHMCEYRSQKRNIMEKKCLWCVRAPSTSSCSVNKILISYLFYSSKNVYFKKLLSWLEMCGKYFCDCVGWKFVEPRQQKKKNFTFLPLSKEAFLMNETLRLYKNFFRSSVVALTILFFSIWTKRIVYVDICCNDVGEEKYKQA